MSAAGPASPMPETEVLCFTSTPANPGPRQSLRQAFRRGDSIATVRRGQHQRIRVVDYVENPVEDGFSVVATICLDVARI